MKKNRAIMRRLEAYADLSAAEVDAAIKSIPGVNQAATDDEVNAIVTAFVETELAALAAAAEMETGTDQQITIKNTPVTSSARQTVASMAPTGSNTPALANLAKLARFTGQNLPSSVRFPVIQWVNGKKDMQTERYRNLPAEAFNVAPTNITYLEVFGGFAFKQANGDFPVGKLIQYRFQNADEDEFLFDVNQGGVVYVSVIAWRHDWKHKDEATGRLVPSTDYVKGRETKPWGRFWCVFKGAEAWHKEHGPVLLSTYGSAVWRFKDILDKTRVRMLNEAEKLIGFRPPDYAFYLPIRPGEPTLVGKEEGKQSVITPPVVDLTDLPEDPADALSLLMLSDDMLALCNQHWDELSRLATEPITAQVEAIAAWDSANAPADEAPASNGGSAPAQTDTKTPGRPNGPGSVPTKKVTPF